jgi:NDP-sugar pyrophosphorylase family protein
MKAMVFAAGHGTRLEPLTRELPKPLVPVGHRPLVAYALDALAGLGLSAIRLNTHHLGSLMPIALEGRAPPGVALDFVHEPRLLGTGGGLRNAFAGDSPREPVVVMNGDVQFAPDLARALEVHRRADAIATMVLVPAPRPDLGRVEVDGGGRVRRLLGRPEVAAGPLTPQMFSGVHVLSPRAFRDLPAEGCIIRSAYRAWVDRGEVVASVLDPGPFADLGTLEAYLEANVAIAEHLASAIHPSARIGRGARIAASIIGAGAEVLPGVTLDRCVVWPGATARHDAADTIFTPRGEVSVGGSALSRRP